MRFTKPAIAALKLPQGISDAITFDDTLPGFGVRLRGGGKRTWIVQYRVGARQRRLTLGSLAVLDLDQARQSAKIALAKVGLAVDPQAEKSRARLDAAATLGPLIKRYLAAKEKRLKPRSFVETERHLMKAWAPLHGQPISTIQRAEIAVRLGVLARDNGPVAADRARAALSGFFGWAMREGLLEANPVIGTNRPAEPVSRDRVLTDAELREVWRAAGDGDHGRIIKLLILTGQRREEVGAMTWRELDLDRGVWSLPAARTKNGRPHDLPLPDHALAILADIPRRADRDLIFGSGQGPFSGWSKGKAGLDARLLEARRGTSPKSKSIAPWRLHDIRRTVATRMSDLGIGPHIVEAVLNHVSGHKAGVAGTYNRSAYAADKRSALALWGAHVEALVGGQPAKVVSLMSRLGER